MALILVILLLAIPLGIGMVMGPCPECPSVGAGPVAECLAVLVGLALLLILGSSALTGAEPVHKALLLARDFERPPRSG